MAREHSGRSSKAARLCVHGDCATSVHVFLAPGECWEPFFRLSVFPSHASCSVVNVTGTGLIYPKCEFGLRRVKTRTTLTTEKSLVAVLHWTRKTMDVFRFP